MLLRQQEKGRRLDCACTSLANRRANGRTDEQETTGAPNSTVHRCAKKGDEPCYGKHRRTAIERKEREERYPTLKQNKKKKNEMEMGSEKE